MSRALVAVRICLALTLGVAVAGCGTTARDTAGQPTRLSVAVDLAVTGALNRMPSMAVSGKKVVVAWTATANEVMAVYVATSDDGGATFSSPLRISDSTGRVSANAEQPPRVTLAKNVVTVIWPHRIDERAVIRMSRSIDGGRTFGAPTPLAGGALTGLRGWQSITAGHGGVAHAVWLDGRHAEPSVGKHHHHSKTDAAPSHQQRAAAPRQDVYSAIIAEDGSTIEAHVARDVCFCCKTAVAVGSTGRVFVAWRHIFPESMRDIALAISNDSGRTFGKPARVSHDNWKLSGCPDDGPSLAVDSGDAVHLVWPTLVGGDTPRKAIFYTSTREGSTFAPRMQLSSEVTEDAGHPQIAVDAAGNIAAAWDEQSGDRRTVMVRILRSAGERFETAQALTMSDSGFHPFVAGFDRGFLVAWPGGSGEASSIRLRRIDVAAP